MNTPTDAEVRNAYVGALRGAKHASLSGLIQNITYCRAEVKARSAKGDVKNAFLFGSHLAACEDAISERNNYVHYLQCPKLRRV